MNPRISKLLGGLCAGVAGLMVYHAIGHATWASYAVAAVELVLARLWWTWPAPALPGEHEPVPPAIKPIDQDDPFCTCPKCGLLGNHAVEIRHQAGLRRVGHGDNWIEIGSWASVAPGPYAHRTCWLCAHEWRTSAS